MAVELPDLDLRPQCAMSDIDPGKRDGLFQDRRVGRAGDDAHLRATSVDAVAMANLLVAFHLETDQQFLWVGFPPHERLATEKILALRGERYGEADPGLERVGLVAEFVPGEDEARLDAQHVERVEPKRPQPLRLTYLPDGVEHGERILWMAEDFIAEFTGISSAGHYHRCAVESADAADSEAEPPELIHGGLRRRRPDHLPQNVTALRSLQRDVVQLIGGRAHPGLQSEFLGEFAQPDAAVIVSADPAEIVVAETE